MRDHNKQALAFFYSPGKRIPINARTAGRSRMSIIPCRSVSIWSDQCFTASSKARRATKTDPEAATTHRNTRTIIHSFIMWLNWELLNGN